VRKITSVNARDPWPAISELVQYALCDESSAGFSERVRRAYRISPRKGQAIFLKLLGNPLSQVREYAVVAGASIGVPAVIAALPEVFDHDPAWFVQELAMQMLHEKAPDVLRGMADVLRRKFTEWQGEDEGDPVMHLAWYATDLGFPELAPQIRQLAGDDSLAPFMREQALVWAAFLEHGPGEILRRIEEHDHEHMPGLCILAWVKDLPEAAEAYERGASQAPDRQCQERCRRFAAAATEAEAAGEPLSPRNRPL
jgi:hypothetical protein